jgi:Arc/MetJ family transcription regulator
VDREEDTMATNLAIDDELLRQAVRLGKQRTKKATVNEALREYVQRRQRLKALDLFGAVDFDPSYDYKAERKKR